MADETVLPELVPGVSLGALIGRGGFASVFRGTQHSLERAVAVKIDSRVMDDERNKRRFMREAGAALKISGHPHVVTLYDAGLTSDGRAYLVMELADRGSVGDLVKQGPMSVPDAVEIAVAVTGALAAAHDAGILHRDVKPANILIDAWGVPRLSDFGLAAMASPDGDMSVTLEAFTPAYAAPEAFSSVTPTPQADVWSMGATIHAMVTGVAPRRASDGSPASIPEIVSRLSEPLTRPSVPGADVLMPVLWKATAVRPEDRYADAGDLLVALKEVAGRVGDPTRGGLATTVVRVSESSPPPAPAAKAGPKRQWPKVALAALVGLVVGIVGVLASGNGPAGQAVTTSSPTVTATMTPSTTATVTPIGTTTPPPELPLVGQCWGSSITMGSEVVSAQKTPCTEPHYGETFAVGEFAASTNVYAPETFTSDANVVATCTKTALDAYTGGKDLPEAEGYVYASRALGRAPDYRGFACVVREKAPRTGSLKP